MCGLQGTVLSTTVTSGYQEILVKMCRNAYIDIQELRKDWPWMRSSTTFSTVAGTTEYSLSTMVGGGTSDIARLVPGMVLYTDSNSYDERLTEWSYNRYIVDDVPQQTQSKPTLFAQDPVDHHLFLNPPNGVYTITVHYFTLPVALSAVTDTPVMPESFHRLIAYMGAAQMAAFMGNSNLFNINNQKADAMLGMLMRSELPGKRVRTLGIV